MPEHIWWKWYKIEDSEYWMIICTAHDWEHLAQASEEQAAPLPQYIPPGG